MGFGFPLFLWALLAIAIPVIIHLFYFRRYKKVYFSSVRFLKEAMDEQKRAGRIQNWLILACRILAVFFLVLAFAQPFLGGKKQGGVVSDAMVVYVDNTFSMGLLKSNREQLSEAKAMAAALVDQLNTTDKVMVLTNELKGGNQRWISKAEALQVIDDIRLSPSANSFQQVMQRMDYLLKELNEKGAVIYVISDFQQNSLLEQWENKEYETVLLPLIAGHRQNISVDSVWLAGPVVYRDAANKLVARIRNQGPAIQTQLNLSVNGEIKSVKDLSLAEDAVRNDTISFNPVSTGWQKGYVSVNDAMLKFDDRMYFALEVASSNKVLLLEEVGSSRSVFNVFRSDIHFVLDKKDAAGASVADLSGYSLVVINELKRLNTALIASLNTYVNHGGTLYIIPSDDADISTYNSLLSALGTGTLSQKITVPGKVGAINEQEPIVSAAFEQFPKNLDLPVARSYWALTSASGTAERNVLKLENGRPYLQMYPVGSGAVYLQASSLQASVTDFAGKVIFAPLVYNMAVFKASPRPLYHTIGEKGLVTGLSVTAGTEQVVKLSKGNYEIIPPLYPMGKQIAVAVPDDLEQDGVYDLVRGENVLSVIACNYNRKESDMNFPGLAALKSRFSSEHVRVAEAGSVYQKTGAGSWQSNMSLWKVCVILALLFLLAEILLLRLATSKQTA